MKKSRTFLVLIPVFLVAIVAICLNISSGKGINDYPLTLGSKKGDIGKINVDLILDGKTADNNQYLTYTLDKGSIESKYSYDVCSSGFCDIGPIEKYMEINNMDNISFIQNVGNLRLFSKEDDKNFYVISNSFSIPAKWKVLIEEKGEYELIELCDISKTDNNTVNFASKIKTVGNSVMIYLESGLYILDNNYNLSVLSYDANYIFNSICDMDLIPSTTRIEYINESLYILCTTREHEFYMVEYNINTSKFDKFKLNSTPQFITSINDNPLIISTSENKVFINTFLDGKIIEKEIVDISNLNLDNFKIQSVIAKLIDDGENIYFVLANDLPTIKAYTFKVNISTLELLGFNEIDINSEDFYWVGTNISFMNH